MKLFTFYAAISTIAIFITGIFFFGDGKTILEITLRSLFMGSVLAALLYLADKKLPKHK